MKLRAVNAKIALNGWPYGLLPYIIELICEWHGDEDFASESASPVSVKELTWVHTSNIVSNELLSSLPCAREPVQPKYAAHLLGEASLTSQEAMLKSRVWSEGAETVIHGENKRPTMLFMGVSGDARIR